MVSVAQLVELLITFTVLLFTFKSVPVSQPVQSQDPETKPAKWNSAIIHFTTYTFYFKCDECYRDPFKFVTSSVSYRHEIQMSLKTLGYTVCIDLHWTPY